MEFLVCVHDVTPTFAAEIEAILAGLRGRIGRAVHLGVVPNWHGRAPLDASPAFLDLLRQSGGELLLHGYEHRAAGGGGWASPLTGGADEFSRLAPAEAIARIRRGCREIAAALRPPRGFIVPAWQMGPVLQDWLTTNGLAYRIGYASLRFSTGMRCRLTTWNWDYSTREALNRLACWAGRAHRWLGAGGMPCLALHPADVRRGLLDESLRAVDALLAAGHQPALASQLAGAWS
jgi:predicted deacetylase